MLDVVIGGVEATVEVGEPSTRVQAGDRPAVLVRPDWASLGGPLPGSVVDSRFRGPATDHVLDTPVGRLAVRSTGASGSTHSSEGWSWHRGWVLPDPA